MAAEKPARGLFEIEKESWARTNRSPQSITGSTPLSAAISPRRIHAFLFRKRADPLLERYRAVPRLRTRYWTVMLTAFDGMPLATTTSELAPVSIPLGTSKLVETLVFLVATPMVLWSCVLA